MVSTVRAGMLSKKDAHVHSKLPAAHKSVSLSKASSCAYAHA